MLPWLQDAAWQRIKAKQDDMNSQASSVSPNTHSRVGVCWTYFPPSHPPSPPPHTHTQDEITYIDNVSETGSKEVCNIPGPAQPHSQPHSQTYPRLIPRLIPDSFPDSFPDSSQTYPRLIPDLSQTHSQTHPSLSTFITCNES